MTHYSWQCKYISLDKTALCDHFTAANELKSKPDTERIFFYLVSFLSLLFFISIWKCLIKCYNLITEGRQNVNVFHICPFV